VALAVRNRIDRVLDTLARAYRKRRDVWPDPELRGCIDQALAAVSHATTDIGRGDALLGLVGIRRGLFPDTPAKDDPA
jgi:hypothetical protein